MFALFFYDLTVTIDRYVLDFKYNVSCCLAPLFLAHEMHEKILILITKILDLIYFI